MKGGMNNWEDLESFKKNEGDGEFKRRIIDNRYPIIYFGGNDNSFKYIIFVDSMWGGRYIAQINESGTKVSIIFWFSKPDYDFIYNNYDLKQNLKKLKINLDNLTDIHPLDWMIKDYLNILLTEINERNEKNQNQRNKNRENYMRNRLLKSNSIPEI
jgi:hypothetical protein